MSTTTDKIDPTVTLDKLIALLQGFRDKLTADGNSDTITRYEALGDTGTLSKYYNKFGGGRALAGAILEVDGKVDKCATKAQLAAKADNMAVAIDNYPGNLIEDTTIEGMPYDSWESVPPEFEVDLDMSESSKMWSPGAAFLIPQPQYSGSMAAFPVTGYKQDETDANRTVLTLRPFFTQGGRLVRGTVEVNTSSAGGYNRLHFRWEYAQTGGGSEEAEVIDIPVDAVTSGVPSQTGRFTVTNAESAEKLREAVQNPTKTRYIRFVGTSYGDPTVPVLVTGYNNNNATSDYGDKSLVTGGLPSGEGLNLYYMITVWGSSGDDITIQTMAQR